MFIDKRNVIAEIHENTESVISVELGCGNSKRLTNSIGIDQINFDCVDIVGDAFEILSNFPSNSVSCIKSFHFMEHVDDPKRLIGECVRVLKKDGILEIVVPHFSNPYYYSDYTHKNFFGLYSLSYLFDTPMLRRVVPRYGNDIPMVLLDVRLIFRGERPFYIRHALGWMLTNIINSSNFLKEFYEINVSSIYSCHELHFISKKI